MDCEKAGHSAKMSEVNLKHAGFQEKKSNFMSKKKFWSSQIYSLTRFLNGVAHQILGAGARMDTKSSSAAYFSYRFSEMAHK